MSGPLAQDVVDALPDGVVLAGPDGRVTLISRVAVSMLGVDPDCVGRPLNEVLTLRDQDGNNTDYYTNSISLGGGESVDVILDASPHDSLGAPLYPVGSKFYLYTPQLDHLSNDAENFGGMMTEVNICNSVDPTTKQCS